MEVAILPQYQCWILKTIILLQFIKIFNYKKRLLNIIIAKNSLAFSGI